MFVAIDRTIKSAFVERHQEGGKIIAAQFLRNPVAAVPYRIHIVLTDNGIQFTNDARHEYAFHHIFDRACDENGTEHRLAQVNHPWTNGQVERMNRTIKEATVKRYHYDSHDHCRQHLGDFVVAYNFGRRLKALKGLTPHEAICKTWQNEPGQFTSNPHHQVPGSNTQAGICPHRLRGKGVSRSSRPMSRQKPTRTDSEVVRALMARARTMPFAGITPSSASVNPKALNRLLLFSETRMRSVARNCAKAFTTV